MSAEVKWTDLGALCREIQKTETPGEAMVLCGLWGSRDGWEPRAQHEVAGYSIDVAIPQARVAIESDGFDHHSKNVDLERDHERQNDLVAAGWVPLRYSAKKAYLTSGQCAVDALREINKRLRGRPEQQERPQPLRPQRMTEEERVEGLALAKAFLKSLAAGPPGETLLIPRRRP